MSKWIDRGEGEFYREIAPGVFEACIIGWDKVTEKDSPGKIYIGVIETILDIDREVGCQVMQNLCRMIEHNHAELVTLEFRDYEHLESILKEKNII